MAKKPEPKDTIGITASKEKDFDEWYPEVVRKSELADYSPVKGCMVIRPLGYAIWETIQATLDKMIKKIGVKNAYFPLFIPESFFMKESEHAEGFSPEVAWIANKEDGERLAVRPTSETVMYDMYSKWIRSHRDLPLRINQWCNVVRWETKATKLLLRTREFLWQEGHCVYATAEELEKETRMYLDFYCKVVEDYLAIPLLTGTKTKKEKFAGADYTLTIEGFMPDGKALQMGTSHNLGQNFAKSFDIKYLGTDEKEHYVWQNSWGLSTRTLGAVVMVHGDDKGLILPPKIAPNKLVIVPIIFEKTKDNVLREAHKLYDTLKKYDPLLDDRDEYSAGWKYNEWEMKGVPLRIEIGPKDIEKKQVMIIRRDNNKKEAVPIKDITKKIDEFLKDMQANLYSKAKSYLDKSISDVKNMDEFKDIIAKRKIAKVNFCGDISCEDIIKDVTGGATSRCIPFTHNKATGPCIQCGKDARFITYFSRTY